MALLASAVLASCSGGGPSSLAVQVTSPDLLPGVELDRIELSLTLEGSTDAPIEASRALTTSDHLERALRVFEGPVAAGHYTGTLRIALGDRVVDTRPLAIVAREGTTFFTVLMTRDCVGVACPGDGDPTSIACLGGRCVPPSCSEEHPELCPMPDCDDTHACAAPSGACASVECTASGVCVTGVDDGLCTAGETCSLDLGCITVDAVAAPIVIAPIAGEHTISVRAGMPIATAVRWRAVPGATTYRVATTETCADPPACTASVADTTHVVAAPSALLTFTPDASWLAPPVGRREFFRVGACVDRAGASCTFSSWSYFEAGRPRSDFDGDGYGDVAVGGGAGLRTYHGSADGLVDVVRNEQLGALMVFESLAADLNGDGYADLVLGIPEAGETSFGVFRGGPTGIEHLDSFPNVHTAPIVFTAGCCTPSAVGDVDVDGRADFVMADPTYDGSGSATDVGSVYLFRGTNDATLVLESGLSHGFDRAGQALQWAGPLGPDASGTATIAVGVPDATHGTVLTLAVVDGMLVPAPTSEIFTTVVGDVPRLGVSIRTGDFDQARERDLVAFAPDGGGPSMISLAVARDALGAESPSAGVRVVLPDVGLVDFGLVTETCDVNGDGFDDLVVGDGRATSSTGALEVGAVIWYFGGTSGVGDDHRSMVLEGTVPGAHFGASVGCSDLNGDGYEETIVGEPFAPGNGRYFVVGASATGPDLTSVVAHPSPAPMYTEFGSNVSRSL
jgi:hypothetical protein